MITLLQYQSKGGATPGTPTVPITNGKFQYSPTKSVRSSAAVINSSGVLVKVLWINEIYSKGTYTKVWDGKDDLGNSVASGTYNIKIVNHNLGYAVKGILGNNSIDQTGPGVWRGFQFVHKMCSTASFVYYALGYNEGWSSIGKFSVSQPLRKMRILETFQTNAVVHYCATDGNYVYWSAYDPAIVDKSFVFATKCSDDTEVNFSSATNTQVFNSDGRVYKAVNIVNAANSEIVGIAVSSAYVYVSRENNTITTLNKTTGAVVATNTVTGCRNISTDASGNVWVRVGTSVKKFTVSAGVLTEDSTPITGLTAPLDIEVYGSTISVVDNSVVKHFNTSGTQTGTLGSGASYVTDPNLADNKFYFKVADGFKPFICYQTDGNLWVGDVGNCRVQKFNGSTFVSNIRFLPHNYNVSIEATVGNRSFIDWLEYDTTDLSTPGNCPLVRNFEPSAPAGYYSFTWHRLEWPLLYPNGKTYAWIKHEAPPTPTNLPKLFEVPTDGPLRLADTRSLPAHSVFTVDPTNHTLRVHTKSGGNVIVKEQALTGTPSDNPTWGSETTILTMPIRNNEPVESDIEKIPQKTSGGYLIMYRKTINSTANNCHLGGVKPGDTNYRWLSERTLGTSYSGNWITGRFDDANQVWNPGGNVFVIGSHVYDVYKGEHWKSSQTNFWTHHTEDGIPLSGFGAWKTQSFSSEAMAEVAGNVQSGGVILRGGKHYIVHNDESIHGGAMVWEVTGLDTIETVTTTVNTPDAVVTTNAQLMVRGTSQEIIKWQRRWNNIEGEGVYLTTGDTGRTASPGDKSLIVSWANKLLNNNKFDTWPTPTKYNKTVTNLDGTVTKTIEDIPIGGPIPKNAIIKDVAAGYATMQAAFVWLCEKEYNPTNAVKYLNAVKVALADQVSNGADARDSVWQNGVIKDINPLFEICMINDRFFEAYDIIKGELTEEVRAEYDAYFYSWAKFAVVEGNLELDAKVTNRWAGNFTPITDINQDSAWPFYKGGPLIPKQALHRNNRRMQFYRSGLKVGLHLKRTNSDGYNGATEPSLHNLNKADYLIQSAKIFMQEVLIFQVAPNGAVGENERTRDSEEKGTHYVGVITTGMADMLDMLYRAGDLSMHNYSTTQGYRGTVSTTPKTFKLAFDWYILNIFSRKYPLVVEVPWNTVQDGVSAVDYYAHDVAIVAALEKYYKNDEWKRQGMRLAPKIAGVQDGSLPLKLSMNNSGSNPWQSGATGDTPGRSFQFMDGGMSSTLIRNIDVFNVTR